MKPYLFIYFGREGRISREIGEMKTLLRLRTNIRFNLDKISNKFVNNNYNYVIKMHIIM